MFESRLKLLLAIMTVPAIAIILRLVQLQVVRASLYREEADALLLQPAETFPCLRGDITDRQGRRLAYDAPSWSICVHYRVLANDRDYVRSLVRGRMRRGLAANAEQLEREIEASWQTISELSGESPEDLSRRAQKIVRVVSRIKRDVATHRGYAIPVQEEDMFHPVARDISQQVQVDARLRLGECEWIKVASSQTRTYAGGEAVGQFLGMLNEVDTDVIQEDPNAGDELRRYQAGDLRGVAGVERLGEQWLRGSRGWMHKDRRGQHLKEPIAPQNGRTFRLTIDLELQRALYDILGAAVAANELSTGGSAVVIDIPTRQVLAMVSFPSLAPDASWVDRLRAEEEDALRRPYLSRAIATYYPPGSIVKPMVLACALSEGVVTPRTQINCQGALFPASPDRFRCTGHHGSTDPIRAIQKSCNVFFYDTGEKMTVPRLARWMGEFGLGRVSGTGLPEEKPGRIPQTRNNGTARQIAIGQGGLDVTPLQAANMIATVASSEYRRATIWLDDPAPGEPVRLPIDEEHWRIVRQGMYEVVNDPEGTAYGPERATLVRAGDYVLLGKTGSAQASQHVHEWLYTCRFPDGREETITAVNERVLRERFAKDQRDQITITSARPYRLWPAEKQDALHAWFAGYTTTRGHYLEPALGARGDLNVAIVLVIECGQKGGAVAAPVARDMIQEVLARAGGSGLHDAGLRSRDVEMHSRRPSTRDSLPADTGASEGGR